jgi:hypothetical protein
MALSSKFAKYDGLIDLLVDLVAREVEAETKTPPESSLSEGVDRVSSSNNSMERRYESTHSRSGAI